jgi:hypothetical protein
LSTGLWFISKVTPAVSDCSSIIYECKILTNIKRYKSLMTVRYLYFLRSKLPIGSPTELLPFNINELAILTKCILFGHPSAITYFMEFRHRRLLLLSYWLGRLPRSNNLTFLLYISKSNSSILRATLENPRHPFSHMVLNNFLLHLCCIWYARR